MDRRDFPVATLAWMLRAGILLEFVGHGMLGLGGVAAWTSYFAVVGLSKPTALWLMPRVGALDVTLGLAALLYPARALVLYLGVWALWTALLRPLAGEPGWETIERAGNYGVPLALFLMIQGGGLRSWLRFQLRPGAERLRAQVAWVLRLTTVLLLLGHGALGLLVHKPVLATQYAAVGLPLPGLEAAVGAAEMLLALAVLVWPSYRLLLAVLGWKLASELLSPLSGSPIWVFIEHGGSYAAPLGLAFLYRQRAVPQPAPSAPAAV